MIRYLSWTVLIVLVLLAFLSSPPIYSQEEVADYEKRLQEIATEIENLKTRIKRDERKKASILTQLDRISTNKRLIKKELSLYDIQMKKATTELSALDRKIPALRAKLEQEKESIGKILTILYKYGRIDFIDFIIEADDMGSLLQQGDRFFTFRQGVSVS